MLFIEIEFKGRKKRGGRKKEVKGRERKKLKGGKKKKKKLRREKETKNENQFHTFFYFIEVCLHWSIKHT
jgi:hypothetical protein